MVFTRTKQIYLLTTFHRSCLVIFITWNVAGSNQMVTNVLFSGLCHDGVCQVLMASSIHFSLSSIEPG